MPFVVSEGQLRNATPAYTWHPAGNGWLSLSDHWLDYATIYRSQPHVRTAVDFIARNIAHLGLHVYRQVGENDRLRLRTHPLARLLTKPNAWTTRHRLVYGLMADRGIYGSSFWLKFKADGVNPASLLRVPPWRMSVQGTLFPLGYEMTLDMGKPLGLRPDQVVHFRNYSPTDNVNSVSPIESLRLILDEDLSSVEHRRDTWSNAGRQPLIIKRPKTAGQWGQDVAQRFSELFTESMHDPHSMTTPILEDDMDIVPLSYNMEQNQYVQARQLTREEVATAYHIPLAMFGIAGAPATYSSVEAYHESLYSDTLGPWLDDIETDIELQLFDDFDEMDGVYVEFNLAQKLAGNFSQRVEVLSKAIGRPWMTADEGRAKENMPSKGGDADKLAVPVNIDPTGKGAAATEPVVPVIPSERRNGVAVHT